MKKNGAAAAAKKARKAFKKELFDKIATQLTTVVAGAGIDIKKNAKAIEKAAKNLADKISKQTTGKKTTTSEVKIKANTTEIKPVSPHENAMVPLKAKKSNAKKTIKKL